MAADSRREDARQQVGAGSACVGAHQHVQRGLRVLKERLVAANQRAAHAALIDRLNVYIHGGKFNSF